MTIPNLSAIVASMPSHWSGRRFRPNTPIEIRLWGRVKVHGECWEWQGHRNSCNYGRMSRGDGDKTLVLAHRLAWEVAVGPIGDGMFVCHRCDNPPCVNPSHLFLGTRQENTQDMVRKGRAADWSTNYRGKLTDEDVLEIRQRESAGESRAALADEFGVQKSYISAIVRNVHRKILRFRGPKQDPSWSVDETMKGKRPVRLTADEVSEVISLRSQGMALAPIAERFGCSMGLISSISIRAGLRAVHRSKSLSN